MTSQPRWWAIRPARNLSASVYTCPLCRGRLPALTDHMLLAPEGDSSRRRHAHTGCVKEARRQGRLPTRHEWEATLPVPPPWWRRARRRLRPR